MVFICVHLWFGVCDRRKSFTTMQAIESQPFATTSMPFPEVARIELPILLELEATGGSDQLRYLYQRLVRYFPQLSIADLDGRTPTGRSVWHARVQRAGRDLEALGELRRER